MDMLVEALKMAKEKKGLEMTYSIVCEISLFMGLETPNVGFR